MRIYRERIPGVARAILKSLTAGELIDVLAEDEDEVQLDIESVLKEYRRADYELTEEARDLVAQRGLDYSHTFKLKSRLASAKKFALGEDAMDWLAHQMVEILLQSKFVDEIFGEDHELRRAIVPTLKKELMMGSDLDRQVKARIRNLNEGTADYDVEYQKAMEQLRSTRKMED